MAFAFERRLQGQRGTRYLDELGTSVGAASGSIGDRSGTGFAGEIFAQETYLTPHAGLGLRAGLMADSFTLEGETGKEEHSFTGWYAMPIVYYALEPESLYVRAGVAWIFSGDVNYERLDAGTSESQSAMGVRGMIGLHTRVFRVLDFTYHLYLDGMATKSQDTSLGSYGGVALVGGGLFTWAPRR